MKYIKLTEKGWEDYTGYLNGIFFEHSVSAEPLSQVVRNRIGAMVSARLYDHTQPESERLGEQVGFAADIAAHRGEFAQLSPVLPRQTEAEKKKEMVEAAVRRGVKYDVEIRSREQLELIASETGITGLRAIGEQWNVRDRAIPKLVDKILKAQNDYGELVRASRDTGFDPSPNVAPMLTDVIVVESGARVSLPTESNVYPSLEVIFAGQSTEGVGVSVYGIIRDRNNNSRLLNATSKDSSSHSVAAGASPVWKENDRDREVLLASAPIDTDGRWSAALSTRYFAHGQSWDFKIRAVGVTGLEGPALGLSGRMFDVEAPLPLSPVIVIDSSGATVATLDTVGQTADKTLTIRTEQAGTRRDIVSVVLVDTNVSPAGDTTRRELPTILRYAGRDLVFQTQPSVTFEPGAHTIQSLVRGRNGKTTLTEPPLRFQVTTGDEPPKENT